MKNILLILIASFSLSGQENIDLEKAQELYDEAKRVYYDGNYELAIAKFDSCLVIRKGHLDEPHELIVKAQQRLGIAATKIRKYKLAEGHLHAALGGAKALEGEESDGVARIMRDLGVLYSRMDYHSKSIVWNEKAMEIHSKLFGSSSKEVAGTRMNNANNYYSMGNYAKCLSEYYEVLKIYREKLEPDDQNYNRVYLTMSNAFRKKGDLNNSEAAARKALEIKLKNYPETHRSVAKYFDNLAKILVELGKLEEAKKYFDKSHKIIESYGNRRDIGNSLNDAARIYLASGAVELAYEQFLEASELLRSHDRLYNNTKINLSKCLFELGEREKGYAMMKEAVIFDPDARTFLRLSKWASRMGIIEEAFTFLDQGRHIISDGDDISRIEYLIQEAKLYAEKDSDRAWGLLNQAIDGFVKVRQSYSGRDSRNFINNELSGVFDYGVRMAWERYKEGAGNFEDLYKVIEQAKAASFWDNLSEENANYYGGVPLEMLEEIEILKEGGIEVKGELEALLAKLEEDYPKYFKYKYSLEVPALADIQQALDDDLALIDYYVLDEKIIALLISHQGKKAITYENVGKISFEEEIKVLEPETRRITIIPHRFIHFAAFDRLIHPGTGQFLLYDYAFSYQVNVNSLLDPVSVDKTLSYLGFVPEWKGDEVEGGLVTRSNLVPLPGAVDEIKEVSAIFNGKIKEKESASEMAFYQEGPNYDIIHFATHAQVDPTNELNSVLYLHKDSSAEDGLLEMDEIMNTELGAGLVILSACETGAGGIQSGEGVMSLARAFQYAGAKSVLMSLWRANDQSSHPIILEFIKSYKDGLSKDVALQQSKIKYIASADPLMRDEFYWAGFMISGELDGYSGSQGKLLYILLGVVFVVLLVFVVYRFA